MKGLRAGGPADDLAAIVRAFGERAFSYADVRRAGLPVGPRRLQALHYRGYVQKAGYTSPVGRRFHVWRVAPGIAEKLEATDAS